MISRHFRRWWACLLLLAGISWPAGKPCLAVSPFRASLAADSGRTQNLRQELIDSLRLALDSSWTVKMAGTCPAGDPELDLFQRPGDLIKTPSSIMLRVRMEWRHAPGTTIVTLEPPSNGGAPGFWSRTLALVARQQMLVPVQVSSDVAATQVHGTLSGEAPLSALLPPGALHLDAQAPRAESVHLDTAVELGLPLQLELHLPLLPEEPKSRRLSSFWPRWAGYAVSSVCFAGAAIFAWREEKADRRYHSLDSSASAGTFSSRWQDVRRANLWRNGLLIGGTGALGIGLVFHFREAFFLR